MPDPTNGTGATTTATPAGHLPDFQMLAASKACRTALGARWIMADLGYLAISVS
jgi:hypothetical protein